MKLDAFELSSYDKFMFDLIYCQPIELMMRKIGESKRSYLNYSHPVSNSKIIETKYLKEYSTKLWSVYLELWDNGALTCKDTKLGEYSYDENGVLQPFYLDEE